MEGVLLCAGSRWADAVMPPTSGLGRGIKLGGLVTMLFFVGGFDFLCFEVGAGTRGARAMMPPTYGFGDRIERFRGLLSLPVVALFAVKPGPPRFVAGSGSLGILG